MTQLSLKEAKRLSIIKWEAHVKAGGWEPNLPEELDCLMANCGFCDRHFEAGEYNCNNCEFGKLAGSCFDSKSLFNKWTHEAENERKIAQAILDIIKSIPDE